MNSITIYNPEAAMKEYLDGWFFSIDFERGRTVSQQVPVDFIPDHRPKYLPEDGKVKTNNGHRWTETEDQTLITLRSEGRTFAEISPIIGLSKSSVQNRYDFLRTQLGLGPRRDNRRPEKYSLETESRVVELRGQGMGFREIAGIVGLTHVQALTVWGRHKDRQRRAERTKP